MKYKWNVADGYECRRHAPIVIENPHYDKDSDPNETLTRYPSAKCLCGDFEELEEHICETVCNQQKEEEDF